MKKICVRLLGSRAVPLWIIYFSLSLIVGRFGDSFSEGYRVVFASTFLMGICTAVGLGLMVWLNIEYGRGSIDEDPTGWGSAICATMLGAISMIFWTTYVGFLTQHVGLAHSKANIGGWAVAIALAIHLLLGMVPFKLETRFAK